MYFVAHPRSPTETFDANRHLNCIDKSVLADIDSLLAQEFRQFCTMMNLMMQQIQALTSQYQHLQNVTERELNRLRDRSASVIPAPHGLPAASVQAPSLTANSEQRVSTSAPASTNGRIRMKKDRTRTVLDLWKEWTVGIDGGPAIRDLEASTNRTWRTSSKTESKYFQRRFTILDAIQKSIDAGLTETEAVSRMEQQRAGRSLNLFSEELRKARGEVTSEEGSV